MKIIKKTILFIILTMGLSIAQVVTAVAPLKAGNNWVYITSFPWTTYTETHQFEVSDSISVINGIPFNIVRTKDTGFPVYTAYYGITSDQFFARYDTAMYDSFYRYFKININIGDTWEQRWNNVGSAILYSSVTDTFSANVFGKYTLIYVLDRTDSVIIGSREYWTKEYGMLNGLYEWAEDILKGCVIDGILYGDTTVTEMNEANNLPDKFQLYQNYPNPFNPSTKISWQSPVGGWQTLRVYDILGREIAMLVNEYRPAGQYEVNWNAGNLPSGVYFYKLQTGNFVETKKMLLLK